MSHYYTPHQDTDFVIDTFSYTFDGHSFEFETSSGVFSKKKVDKGTSILLKACQIPAKSKVLDIGCGIGVVGVIVGKVFDSEVTLSEVNTRALTLAKDNLKKNDVQGKVVESHLYEKIKGTFDVILSNPPQSAGKKVCMDLITGAKDALTPQGSLQLVARKNKGGATLAKHMEEVFGNVDVLEKSGGFWVYKSVKN